MSAIGSNFDPPHVDLLARERDYDKAAHEELCQTVEYLNRTEAKDIPQDKIYEILAKKKEFKPLKKVAICSRDYQEYRALSKLLQKYLWGDESVSKSALPSLSDQVFQVDCFVEALSQPLDPLDEFHLNAEEDIQISSQIRQEIEEEFTRCYPAFSRLGKKRAGPFFEVSSGGTDKVYARKNCSLVFRVATKEHVEYELNSNAGLQRFVKEKHLDFIRVPQSTSLDFKADETKAIYVEQRIPELFAERNISAFGKSLVDHYVEGTPEFKRNLCALVRQVAVLVGRFPLKGCYVVERIPAIYATSIYSGPLIFGQRFTKTDMQSALRELVDSFPLNAILNDSVVLEYPEYPIPSATIGHSSEPKADQTLPDRSEPLFPPHQFPLSVTEIKVDFKLPDNHTLAIRGQGADLNWSKGRALDKVDEMYVYRFQGQSSHIEYKILLDDIQWEIGKNHRIKPGKVVTIAPSFSTPKPTTLICVKGGPEDELYIRGQGGAGLSWDKGIEMKYANGQWTFETNDQFVKLEYKVLKKDQIWERGWNHTSLYKTKLTLSPTF